MRLIDPSRKVYGKIRPILIGSASYAVNHYNDAVGFHGARCDGTRVVAPAAASPLPSGAAPR